MFLVVAIRKFINDSIQVPMGSVVKIGRGDIVVNAKYENFTFGPIYAKDENEVKTIYKVFNDKIQCHKEIKGDA